MFFFVVASATVNSALPTPATSVLGMPPVVAPLLQPPAPSILGLHDLSLQIPPPAPTIDIAGVPSECLLLKNMFDPSIEVGWSLMLFFDILHRMMYYLCSVASHNLG